MASLRYRGGHDGSRRVVGAERTHIRARVTNGRHRERAHTTALARAETYHRLIGTEKCTSAVRPPTQHNCSIHRTPSDIYIRRRRRGIITRRRQRLIRSGGDTIEATAVEKRKKRKEAE